MIEFMRKYFLFLALPLWLSSCEYQAKNSILFWAVRENLRCPVNAGNGLICDSVVPHMKEKNVSFYYSYSEDVEFEELENYLAEVNDDEARATLASALSSDVAIQPMLLQLSLADFSMGYVYLRRDGSLIKEYFLTKDEYMK